MLARFRNAFVFLTLLPLSSTATCTDQIWKPGWSWTYDGTIGPYRVRFELVQTGGNITGYYFYVSQLKDIPLTGTLAGGKQIQLKELGADGKLAAEITGGFPDNDPQGKLKGNLTCDIIMGTWQKAGDSNKLPVYLRTTAGLPDPHGHRYQVAGANDDETINRAAQKFQKAVASEDKDTVASMIRYPIRVYVGQETKINNREQMLTHYDAIFTPAYRKAIENSIPRDMFARSDGIMLGDGGEVWFDDGGRVVALNSLLTK